MQYKNRYITNGVAAKIPSQLVLLLWNLLDKEISDGKELDYLQIFELETLENQGSKKVLKIVHRQEIPERESINHLDIFADFEIKEKLYIILDKIQKMATMMLVQEY